MSQTLPILIKIIPSVIFVLNLKFSSWYGYVLHAVFTNCPKASFVGLCSYHV